MALTKLALIVSTIATTLLSTSHAQAPNGTPYTDPTTNISFSTWDIPKSSGAGPLTFGLALPTSALETDATEFIGYLQCAPAKGWCGISLGGAMTDSLLLVAYPDPANNTVKHSLRFTPRYTLPGLYGGNATVTPIQSNVTDDSFTSIFRCQGCLHWSQNGTEGAAATSSGHLDLAFALASEGPRNSACPDEATFVQHSHQGTWLAFVDEGATGRGYDGWAEQARGGGKGGC
ncbi:hypothetical protein BJX76DRAFT_357184 [Aspergillus varians]